MIKLTDDIALCNEPHKKYHGKYCKIATLSNFMLFIKNMTLIWRENNGWFFKV